MGHRWLPLLLAAGVIIAGCSSSPEPQANEFESTEPIETVLVSSPDSIGLGPQRLIFLLEKGPLRIGDETMSATVALKGLGLDEQTIDADWIWSDEAGRHGGAWIAQFDFPATGTWRAILSVEDQIGAETTFRVRPDTPMPRSGDRAPRSDTATAETADLASLTTDPTPDERFYTQSVATAVESGRPTALVFATPAFCTTEVCGPLLDAIQDRIDDHPGINFVHVEVYEDVNATGGELIPRPPVVEWGIATEPWVFFVDGSGTVVSSFEGVMSAAELDRELAALG